MKASFIRKAPNRIGPRFTISFRKRGKLSQTRCWRRSIVFHIQSHLQQMPKVATAAERAIRQRVTVACVHCRNRKTRCDGAQPCHNCERLDKDCEFRPVTLQENQIARARKQLCSTKRSSKLGRPSVTAKATLPLSPDTVASSSVLEEAPTRSEPLVDDLVDEVVFKEPETVLPYLEPSPAAQQPALPSAPYIHISLSTESAVATPEAYCPPHNALHIFTDDLAPSPVCSDESSGYRSDGDVDTESWQDMDDLLTPDQPSASQLPPFTHTAVKSEYSMDAWPVPAHSQPFSDVRGSYQPQPYYEAPYQPQVSYWGNVDQEVHYQYFLGTAQPYGSEMAPATIASYDPDFRLQYGSTWSTQSALHQTLYNAYDWSSR